MKKVLIALDYNPSAEKVAETGHRLAKSMDAEVVLLHVVSDFKYYASLNYSPIMGFDSFSNVIETEGSGELKGSPKITWTAQKSTSMTQPLKRP